MPNLERPIAVVRATSDLLTASVVEQSAELLADLVQRGAALGWVDPPSVTEVADLLQGIVVDSEGTDAALVWAWSGDQLAGLGYWKRYARPTHRPNADVEKVAVSPGQQGRGVGRAVMIELLEAAREADIEVLTLDLRGDNLRAERLYASLGFVRYGLLERFVAVRGDRYDKILMALDLRS